MKTYALYDTADNECLVFMGSMKELEAYTGKKQRTISSNMSRGLKLLHRYEVAVIEEDEDERGNQTGSTL